MFDETELSKLIGEIYEGANEIQSWVIARHIFGREMTG